MVSMPLAGGEPHAGTPLRAESVLDVSAEHGEGVVWDPDAKRLLFVDIPTGRVFEHDPRSGETVTHSLDRDVSAVHPAGAGALVVAVREGIALLREGALHMLAAPLAHTAAVRMNDGNVDPRGRLFAGSMAYDAEEGAGALYRLDPDGRFTTVLENVSISNGIDWSPAGGSVYYIDSPTRRVDVFDYDLDSGRLSRRRPFAVVEDGLGLPDGLTVDAGGGVWVALFGGGQVRRYAPDGTLDRIVCVPGAQLVTSCCFGGDGLGDLYISTSTEGLSPEELRRQPGAGRIYRCVGAGNGKPASRFRAEHG